MKRRNRKFDCFRADPFLRTIAFLLLCAVFSSGLCFDTSAQVYRSVPTEKRRIALTFDDGPHPRLTPQILEILRQYHVRATFFMIGKNIEDYPETAALVAREGHEIGNHTFSHLTLANKGQASVLSELNRCDSEIQKLGRSRTNLFRPPEGAIDRMVLSVAEKTGHEVVLWNLDTRDWEEKDAGRIVNRVLSSVKPGDVILMHDFIGRNSKTPEALKRLLPKLLARGYEIVTVGELLGIGPDG